MGAFKLHNVGFQLHHIFDPGLSFDVFLAAQHLQIPALFQQGVIQLAQRQIVSLFLQALDHPGKGLQAIFGPGQIGIFPCPLDHGKIIGIFHGCQIGHMLQGLGADLPGRIVDDPPQPDTV